MAENQTDHADVKVEPIAVLLIHIFAVPSALAVRFSLLPLQEQFFKAVRWYKNRS